MARKPFGAAEIHVPLNDIPAEHALTLAEQQETKDIETEMAFVAAKIVGRVETALFYETISQKVVVESYLELKQNNAFMTVSYRDADGNVKRISCLHEFCERVFKKSYRRVQQLVDNYHTIGADLFDTAEQIGFRQKDYAALKALPADDQEIIKQAMQPEVDRDQILDLMQELAVRHASEKAALTAQATEALETAASRDDVIGTKQALISKLEIKLASAKRRQANFTDEEKRDYECAPLHDTINDAMLALAMMATQVKYLVEEVGGELVTEECFHAVLLPIKRALEIANFHRLHIDLATLFDESFNAPLEELQARAAGLTPEVLQ